MEDIRRFIAQHKRVALVAAFLLVCFVGFSAMSAVTVAARRSADSAAKSQATAQPAKEQQKADDGHGQGEDNSQQATVGGDATLSDAQRSLVDSYDERTRKLVQTLAASVWSANNGRNTLRFYEDGHYVETVGDTATAHPFAISAVDWGNNGSDTEMDTLAVETDTGTHLLSYTLVISADAADAGKSAVSSSTMFSLKGMAYTRTDAAARIDVTGLNSEITAILGNDTDLVTQLSDWCSIHYPSATTAAWSKSATIDWDAGIVVTSFAVSGDGGMQTTNVTVTYTSGTGQYEFGN